MDRDDEEEYWLEEEDKRKIFRDLYEYKSTEQLKCLLMANYSGLWKKDEECVTTTEQVLEKGGLKRGRKLGEPKKRCCYGQRGLKHSYL